MIIQVFLGFLFNALVVSFVWENPQEKDRDMRIEIEKSLRGPEIHLNCIRITKESDNQNQSLCVEMVYHGTNLTNFGYSIAYKFDLNFYKAKAGDYRLKRMLVIQLEQRRPRQCYSIDRCL